jgi:hypothetical protein
MPHKKKPLRRGKAPAKLKKFWEEPPTLHDLFEGYPEAQKVQLAIHDYEHGSAELLSKLVMEKAGQVLPTTWASGVLPSHYYPSNSICKVGAFS